MKKQINEANILRGIACLAVVLVHISAIPVSTLQSDSIHMKIFSLLNRSVKFTTPTFIFLSGLTMFYSYKDKTFHYFSFLKKRFSATLIPYFLWSLIYYKYFIDQGYYIFSWDFLIENLLLADMSYHLYFILTILQFYLLFGVFLYIFKRFNHNYILIFLLAISIFTVKYVRFPYADRFFARYAFYFGLGCYTAMYIDIIREKLLKYKYLITAGYISISCYYGYQFYQYYGLERSIDNFTIELTWFSFCLIAIMFYSLVAYQIATKENSVLYGALKKISKASYYIYLSHPLAIFVSEKFLTNLGMLSITRRFLLNIIIVYGMVVPLAVLYSSLKYKLTQYFKSRKRKKVTLQRGL
ncbi:Surface polysaccharide O-acyltransferase, integral membrane enzyme [Anaerovirgula multivorans]|uniref:Surface polysaccharide O-acyltransferase, integral membrane enzyme n=1 Tax=Anaerovirgula multivorans TaxID=312168 RepID=A0A239BQQ6_9FIRM|nr:acyltransferase [Anaerovirgula multivorans]SNS09473.1 Surface polysaccharide O-acyltransferase, integral membrane enzyme [Anaerovirgula multivorans]